ncbi:MAG: DNA mismatch repair endonuclease MutL [Schleiferiaceae bacterium]|jgi:DNA mismatch repair protein MutL|nr:DNA mismatch repair endonuclease MutL [Schleiferiaceae bacterium]MDR9441613.1 DNA mismatch repair endonuclease MutL [Schleiferiaceae bacterium]
MADVIRLLPDNVANQIAAGEVVQRPASAVKELLENSIDAQATKIQLTVEEAGKSRLLVVDNGTGLSETDARMAFERHATSKISRAEDIFAILTKGFRGEALASIAAVAQVELKSRPENQDLGTCLRVEGGKVTRQEFCNTPAGTRIEVHNLFYNIPARRNFLKSDNVELRHIIDEFERVALAHPPVQMSMEHNGGNLFELPSQNLRQRIVGIFGKKFNERLVPVEETTPLLKLSGFIGKPEYARKTRGEQFFFANHRFIRSGYLHRAVCRAFEGLLPADTHPSYFLFLELDPQRIDVNIHPTKTEVKFEDDKAIHTIVQTAVKHALGQHNISPSLDFETEQQFTPPRTGASVKPPGVHVNPHFNPFDQASSGQKAPPGGQASQPPTSKQSQEWESLLNQLPEVPDQKQQQTELLNESQVQEKRPFLQIARKYIATYHSGGLLLIHQQRAHERILYEQLRGDAQGGAVPSQQLLFPTQLQYSRGDFALIQELFPTLRTLGFDLDNFGNNQLIVQGLPLHLAKTDPQAALDQILENEKENKAQGQRDMLDEMARQLAKVAALRSGTVIDQVRMAGLVEQLFACHEPALGIFGQAVTTHFRAQDIDKYF